MNVAFRAAYKRVFLHIPELCLLIITIAVVVLLCAEVVFRYAIGSSLDWIEEMSRVLLIWLAFIGAAVALKRNEHITVEYFLSFVPQAMRYHIEVLSWALIVLFSAFLCAQGIEFALLSRGTTFPALQVAVSWQYLGLPVGALLMTVYGLQGLIASVPQQKLSITSLPNKHTQ